MSIARKTRGSILKTLLLILLAAVLTGCTGSDERTSLPVSRPSAPSVVGGTDAGKRTVVHDPCVRAELDYYLQRHNPLDEGFDIVARYAAEGDTTIRAYLPHGPVSLSCHLGVHHGKGMTRDHQGRPIVGRFHADTLVSGLRFDADGLYAGQMNRYGDATGHGAYLTADGTYYEGHWEHNQREGFGLSVGPTHVKIGTWLRDAFRGERMSYHSDRIYGIDISRYQHEKGRRRFNIDWRRLRIVHLGRRISQQRVLDTLNYPVSFVYIKSTEGTTIENRYYAADDAAARQHGLAVGAYHFFSTKTPPDDQARYFLQHTRFSHGDLPPMLDIEPSDNQIEAMGGPLVLFQNMRVWLHAVEQAVGVRPLLYVNQRFVNTYMDEAPDLKADYHFWIARYGEYKPDIHLDLWQLSGDGRVSGITPEVDLNVFNGYQGHWDEFLRTSTVP